MTLHKAVSLFVLSAFTVAAHAQRQPWPGDQPYVAPAVVNPAGNPVVYQQPQMPKSSNGGSGGGAQAQQMIQQVMSAMGGDREIASGGDQGSDSGYGHQSAVNVLGSAGTAGGEPLKMVEGCSKDTNKVSFVFSEGKSTTTKCEDVKMSEVLSDMLDAHFMRCARKGATAAGMNVNGPLQNVKIHHKGVIGDANHSPGSYHARLMAIDVSGVEIDGRLFGASKNGDDAFFTAFRQCWGDAINGMRGGCLSNAHPASVGEEDSKHNGSHLHISVPYCPQYARANGIYIAKFIQWFFGEVVHAAEKNADGPPATTYKGKTVVLKDGSAVKLVVGDLHGEPVGADQRMTLSYKCKTEKSFRQLDEYVEGCRYDGLDIDEAGGFATIRYTVSQMTEQGVLECSVKRTKILKLSCK